jgi:RimJ/RimL family protein N-acetyltransferase
LLETERLVLRKPRPEDVDDLLVYIEDPEVMRWTGSGVAGDRDVAEASVRRWLRHWDANGIGHFVVVLGGRVIGRAGFLVWDASRWAVSSYSEAGTNAVTELGWTIAQPYWGRGYATEAARAARAWGYEERRLDGLISLIITDNLRSQRVATKLGAVQSEEVEIAGTAVDVWRHQAPAR